jgi:hypothetical protein
MKFSGWGARLAKQLGVALEKITQAGDFNDVFSRQNRAY